MGFPLPWPHGYTPSASSVPGTDLVYDTTIEETDVGRLLYQFRGKPRIEALISELCAGRLGRLEIALWQCLVERRIDTAIGEPLAVLGRVLGVERAGRTDESLRRRIRAEALVLRSSGEPDRMIRIAYAFLAVTSGVELEELFPGSGRTVLNASIAAADALELARLNHRAKPAGVRWLTEWAEYEGIEAFTLGTVGDPVSEDLGFGYTADPDLGGRLAGVSSGSE